MSAFISLIFFTGLYISNIVASVYSIITWDRITSPTTFIFLCVLCGINAFYGIIGLMFRIFTLSSKRKNWSSSVDTFFVFVIAILNCFGLSYLIDSWIKSGQATTSPATFGFFIGILQINIVYICLIPACYFCKK